VYIKKQNYYYLLKFIRDFCQVAQIPVSANVNVKSFDCYLVM